MRRTIKHGSRRASRREPEGTPTTRGKKVVELPTAPEALLTSAQVAALLGLKNEATLAVWRSTKRYPLPFVKLGHGIVRYRRADVEAFVAARVAA